jgi:hypothetical protein
MGTNKNRAEMSIHKRSPSSFKTPGSKGWPPLTYLMAWGRVGRSPEDSLLVRSRAWTNGRKRLSWDSRTSHNLELEALHPCRDTPATVPAPLKPGLRISTLSANYRANHSQPQQRAEVAHLAAP